MSTNNKNSAGDDTTSNAVASSSSTDHHSSFDMNSHPRRSGWYLPSSLSASRTLNPIRAIVDKLVVPSNSGGKSLIPLSIGDPTVFGNLQPPASTMNELMRLIQEGKSNGYAPSTGILAARAAIARRFTAACPYGALTAGDVMICSGASGALQIAMDACLNAGDNILIPKPGFSLYATIAGYLNVEVRYYDLLPDKNWECDLTQAATLIDDRTRCLLINNPSNPNGSNFSRAHLQAIIALAEQYKLLVISDEIYGDMVFTGQVFTPIADVSPVVPIITIGGLAKQYVVPGWRIGWILFHDRDKKLAAIKNAANSLTQVILGANTLIQHAIPAMLLDTPPSYYSDLNHTLEEQALFLFHNINNNCVGLQAIEPQGAMYLMVRIHVESFPPSLQSDVSFSAQLLQEEMLFVLPGSCFLANNFIRLVTCAPKYILEQAVARLKHFCERHRIKHPSTTTTPTASATTDDATTTKSAKEDAVNGVTASSSSSSSNAAATK